LVTRLNLKDPDAFEFRPDRCRSFHDIVRYVHEKGMQEIFLLGGRTGRGLGRAPKLETDLPLALYVVDLRRRGSWGRGKTIRIDDVGSVPLEAVWKGVEGASARWEDGLYHVDWETIDRISGGIFAKDARFLSSYALVSRDYMHMLIRFGYHFTVLDTLCGTTPGVNYIAFRFKGGGGGSAGGRFRLHFIRTVLEACPFQVTIRGDMLDARVVRVEEATVRRLLSILGGLLAKTRLLDMSLTSKAQAEDMATSYLKTWQVIG
jgi:pyruvate,water dikinase